jgi:DNA-binding MarR family transcriptional regulator
MAALKHEISQQRPFSSPQEEALLNLMRTADCLNRSFHRHTRELGITGTQYNVLRILRGAHPEGLACAGIGDRMITAEPDITRLLTRLKALKLVHQQRDKRDRRVVLTHISETGLALLEQMDPVVVQMPKDLLGHLREEEVAELSRLLELARQGCGDPLNQPTCDGAGSVNCDGSGAVSCDGAHLTAPATGR